MLILANPTRKADPSVALQAAPYTAQLQAGLGLVTETKALLGLWRPEMTAAMLNRAALESGEFAGITARRLRNIVVECFAPRYLSADAVPAQHLKIMLPTLNQAELKQLLLLFTCRSTAILSDFIRQVYWPRYAAGDRDIHNATAKAFIERAIDDGKTVNRWADRTVQSIAGRLTGCCADYGLLEDGPRRKRQFLPLHIADKTTVYLAYDLHCRGLGDGAMLSHPDWALYGLTAEEVLAELKRLARNGWFLLQVGGEVVRISWQYEEMGAVCDAIAKN